MIGIKKSIQPVIGMFLILMLSSCSLLPMEDEVLQPPLRAPERIEYKTIEVTLGTIVDEVRGSGAVEAKVAATVSFREAEGRLKEMYFSNGQDVEEGDLLAELHNDAFLEALERQELYTRLAEIEHEKLHRETWLSRLDREAAQIRMDLANLDLEKARVAVEKTLLYAPISGRIVYKAFIQTDDYIDSFRTLYSIADLTQLMLRVSDSHAPDVPVGAEVSVIAGDETYKGTVVQAPSLNPADVTDRYDTIIEVPDLELGKKKLGDRFQIIYERARAENVIVIERSLIRIHGGRTFVIVLADDLPMERNVVLGVTNNSYAEIIDGLQEGELLIQ